VGYSDVAPAVERGEAVAGLPDGVVDALDLLKRMLSFFPEDRIGAAEALEHPFFAPIREQDTEVG
jgi:serine/threonine protein kinase